MERPEENGGQEVLGLHWSLTEIKYLYDLGSTAGKGKNTVTVKIGCTQKALRFF